MAKIKIKDFSKGYDTRRSVLEAVPGSLVELVNAVVNQGAEIEHRKKFLRWAMPAGTFGAQSVGAIILTFGSAASGTIDLSGVPAEFTVTYQRLQHPAVLDGAATYDANSHAMEEVIHSTVFGTAAFVIARFSDDQVFVYYDGSVVRDFFAGEVLNYLDNNVKLAANIVVLINAQGDYTATQLTFATTNRQIAANVATLTFVSTTGLVSGMTVTISGGLPAAYLGTVVLTGVTATQVTYAAVAANNGPAADVTGILTSPLIAVTGSLGAEFQITTFEDSVGGSFGTPTTTAEYNPGVAGVSAVGSFKITGGRVGGAATGTLTNDGTNVTAADTVTIGTKVYTFVSPITNVEGQVLRGASNTASMQNLIDAINHSGTGGSQYYCALPNPNVQAGPLGGAAFTVVARIGGTAGNAIATTEASTHLSWGAATLAGGTATAGVNTISSVKVVSPAGVSTELLAAAVEFVSDIPTTVTAIVTAINANQDVSLYSAVQAGNVVNIYSRTTANPQPNGYDVVVIANGNVCVGNCYFYFAPTSQSTWKVTAVTVDGVDILGADITLNALTPANLTNVYATMETQINAASVAGIAHGINACAHASYIQISKRQTSSADNLLVVLATTDNGSTIFVDDNPEVPPNPDDEIRITLDPTGFADTLTHHIAQLAANNFPSVSATVTGGIFPYTFQWVNAYDYVGFSGPVAALTSNKVQATLVANPAAVIGAWFIDDTLPTCRFEIYMRPSAANYDSRSYTFAYRCKVTDAAGTTALSDFFNFVITVI
jgi:hypothetical protein